VTIESPRASSGPSPVAAVEATPEARPQIRAILRHLGLSLLMANIVPSVLFYVCLVSLGVWAALVAALAWCYGATAWRMVTRRRMSALLTLTLVGLSLRTAVAFASGSTFLYFLQPVLNNTVVALLFLLSLATARPVVARVAADFFPMTEDIAKRPRVERLFWHLTLLWAVVAMCKASVTFWLLQSQSVTNFVLFKDTFFLAMTVLAVSVTVSASVWVARKEGLLHRHDAAHQPPDDAGDPRRSHSAQPHSTRPAAAKPAKMSTT
jgi:hypothetical protein